MIDTPMHFEDAIGFLLNKRPNPQEWVSTDWAAEKPAVRVRSFFSSQVESARFLDRAQGLIFDYLAKVRDDVGNGETALRVGGRADFVMLMREFMIREGMAKPEEFKAVKQGDVTDVRSVARLRLIFDTNVRQAYGYGQWKQGMKPAVRRAFPASRFVRERPVAEPRPRHSAHEGEVRLKTDLNWWAKYQNDPAIGGFGVPWSPYGFHSGMGQEDVSRAEAKRLGLPIDTDPGEMNQPGLNEGLQASVRNMAPETKRKLLEELRGGPDARDPEDAAREAAVAARARARARHGLPPERPVQVIDQGDSIRLAEDIGERISKVKNREGLATPDQKRAIAEAVFQRVDRKAAEPKTQPDGGKGAPRDRQLFASDLTLTPEERLMLESPYEILLVHTPDGRLKEAVLGTKTDSTVPDRLPAGAILSHNHPGGRGPSASDIKAILSRSGMTLRIVTVNEAGKVEIFSLQAAGVPSREDIAALAEAYEELAVSGGDTAQARRDALALIMELAGDILLATSRIFP